MPGRPKGHGFSPLIIMNRFEWDCLFLLSLAGNVSILMSIPKKFDRPSDLIPSLVSLLSLGVNFYLKALACSQQ